MMLIATATPTPILDLVADAFAVVEPSVSPRAMTERSLAITKLRPSPSLARISLCWMLRASPAATETLPSLVSAFCLLAV